MKKYTVYKTIQLIIFIAAAAAVLIWIFPNAGLYHQIADDPSMKILAFVAWGVLFLSFIFILLDFTFFFRYMKKYKELELLANSDPISGIANRFNCDVLIEKYLNGPLPENTGAIMIDLTNIQDVSRKFGQLQGSMTVRDFANILRISSNDLCFVGKNGSNRFLALFENSSDEKMQDFISRVTQRVSAHNRAKKNCPIVFLYGAASSSHDNISDISALISLADSRIPSGTSDQ